MICLASPFICWMPSILYICEPQKQLWVPTAKLAYPCMPEECIYSGNTDLNEQYYSYDKCLLSELVLHSLRLTLWQFFQFLYCMCDNHHSSHYLDLSNCMVSICLNWTEASGVEIWVIIGACRYIMHVNFLMYSLCCELKSARNSDTKNVFFFNSNEHVHT